MAKRKKRTTLVGELEEAVSDVANAFSVAATGSQIGILGLAAEEEMAPTPRRRRKPARKVKPVARKRKKTKAARVAPSRKRPSRKKKRKSRKTPNRRR
jgi:hypothetical protein